MLHDLVRRACDDGRKMWNEEYFWTQWDIYDFYVWGALQQRSNSIQQIQMETKK